MGFLFAAIAAALGFLAVFVLNKMPERSFCDYGEEPTELHKSPRFSYRLHAVVLALFGAITGYLLYRNVEIAAVGAILIIFCTLLFAIALSDAKYFIIPDELVIASIFPALAAAIIKAAATGGIVSWLSPLIGAAIGGFVIAAINLVGRLIYKRDALGMGDLKLMAACGLALGGIGTVVSLVIGVVTAGVSFAVLMLLNKTKGEEYRPLGPYLIFGTVAFLALRPWIFAAIDWYISLLS